MEHIKGPRSASTPTLIPNMITSPTPPTQWQRRQRIRPKACRSTSDLVELFHNNAPEDNSNSPISATAAETLGPPEKDEIGLAIDSSRPRSLKLLLAHAHHNLLLPPKIRPSSRHSTQTIVRVADYQKSSVVSNPAAAGQTTTISDTPNPESAEPADSAALSDSNTPSASAESVQSQPIIPSPFPPSRGIAIRHEYILQMSRKSKRTGRGLSIGSGGPDIMDSLVSSIDDIESKQMRGLFSNGNHRRDRSEEFQSVIMVSPAPVIQTSKSSTRSPNGTISNKLTRRSPRSTGRDPNGRLSLRSSNSHEHWLPPIEQEEDIFSIPNGRSSYHPPSPRHPSIPTRNSSITHEYVSQRSNSLMHIPAPAPIVNTRPTPRRAETNTEIPSYITKYLRERTDSKENLNLEIPRSPRRSFNSTRSRNSTTAIPANDQFSRLKLVTKRQSTPGFEGDLSATRAFYSLPSPTPDAPRRSASLRPSRNSIASDGSSTLGKVNNNYAHEVLSNPKLTQRIRLTSGRILSFSEVNLSFDILIIGRR